MKIFTRFLFVICFFVLSSKVFGQVSNLLVNGSSTHFTMQSGSEISWSYDLPVGGTALLEIWIDANSNTFIEPLTDVLWESFYQIDGQQSHDGPPDMDGLANGQIVFSQPVGLASGEYIMSFSNNNSTVMIPGTVTPLTSPAFIISGNVTVPPGKSAQYLALSLNSENGEKFWNAITDINGNFSVLMDADTSGNPWRLGIDNTQGLSPAIQTPDRINLTLDAGVQTSYSGNNFTFLAAAAEVNGTVKDDDGNPLAGTDVFISAYMQGWSRNTRTDFNGNFSLGLLSSDLPANDIWLGSGNSEDNSMVSAGIMLPTVYSGNVLTRNLFVYKANSTISGTVTLSGNPPNMNLEIYASVTDTAFVRTWTDYNGNYTLNVTNKLYNYMVSVAQLPPGYMPHSEPAHPGQTNVNFTFNLTDVQQDQSTIPSEFSLSQNYPNPFNPTTRISWQSPVSSLPDGKAGRQVLNVFDVLGNEIKTLVNEEMEAGYHSVDFNASELPSGVYFYRLQAGNFVDTKKMILLR